MVVNAGLQLDRNHRAGGQAETAAVQVEFGGSGVVDPSRRRSAVLRIHGLRYYVYVYTRHFSIQVLKKYEIDAGAVRVWNRPGLVLSPLHFSI
jgi:hypothetical protein